MPVTPARSRWRDRVPPTPRRSEKCRILIVGEGQTEPIYFREMYKSSDEIRRNYVLNIESAKGHSPLAVVEYAVGIRRRKRHEFDETWCALDVEGPAKAKSLVAAKKLAKRERIRLFLSNPCFEVWLLMHFRRAAKPFLSAAQVLSELQPVWQKEYSCSYGKTDERLYFRLRDRMDDALANSEWVCRHGHDCQPFDVAKCNSSTEIHLLIRSLKTPWRA